MAQSSDEPCLPRNAMRRGTAAQAGGAEASGARFAPLLTRRPGLAPKARLRGAPRIDTPLPPDYARC